MGLFGPRKPKFEESALIAEKTWNDLEATFPEDTRTRRAIFANGEGSSAFFAGVHEGMTKEARRMIAELRTTKDEKDARWILGRLSDTFVIVWLASIMDSISEALFRQREFTLRLLDAIAERNEQKIAKLKDEMKERTLTAEQREVVDSILKGFKESQDALDGKK